MSTDVTNTPVDPPANQPDTAARTAIAAVFAGARGDLQAVEAARQQLARAEIGVPLDLHRVGDIQPFGRQFGVVDVEAGAGIAAGMKSTWASISTVIVAANVVERLARTERSASATSATRSWR